MPRPRIPSSSEGSSAAEEPASAPAPPARRPTPGLIVEVIVPVRDAAAAPAHSDAYMRAIRERVRARRAAAAKKEKESLAAARKKQKQKEGKEAVIEISDDAASSSDEMLPPAAPVASSSRVQAPQQQQPARSGTAKSATPAAAQSSSARSSASKSATPGAAPPQPQPPRSSVAGGSASHASAASGAAQPAKAALPAATGSSRAQHVASSPVSHERNNGLFRGALSSTDDDDGDDDDDDDVAILSETRATRAQRSQLSTDGAELQAALLSPSPPPPLLQGQVPQRVPAAPVEDSDDEDAGPAVRRVRSGKERAVSISSDQEESDAPAPRKSKGKGKKRSAEKKRSETRGKKRSERRSKKRRKGGSDDDDDLRQNLNVDAYVRSTSGAREKRQRERRMAWFQRARERRRDGLSTEEEPDTWSSPAPSSASEDDSDDSSSVSDSSFVKSDDAAAPPNPYGNAPPRVQSRKEKTLFPRGPDRSGPSSRHPAPQPASVLAQTGLLRLTTRQHCEAWVRWITLRLLRTVSDEEAIARLAASRAQLQELVAGLYKSLTTQTMRRSFYWHLRHYGHFERRPVASEVEGSGCAACGRASHPRDSYFTFSGRFYDRDTLAWLTAEQDGATSSDCTTGRDEDVVERQGQDPKTRKRSFYLGASCALRAKLMHALAHWEFHAMRAVKSNAAFQQLQKEIQDQRRTPSGDDIENVVQSYAPRLEKQLRRFENESRDAQVNQGMYKGGPRERDTSTWKV